MSKHTPGPWMVAGTRCKLEGQAAHNIFRYAANQKRDETIASVWYDTKTGLGMADARLIAAAPDLLAALSALIANVKHIDADGYADCDMHRDEIEAARAVITKATGDQP